MTDRSIEAHVADVRDGGERLATAVEAVPPDARIPTCPDWTLRDLARHTGGVHRWATLHVVEARTELADVELEELAGGWPDDAGLADWLRDGVSDLADALATAPSDLECVTFLPAPSPLAFWARRQAHETTIHRVDAERAGGGATPIDPALAADGVGELLFGFASRPRKLLADEERILHLHATDTGDDWTIRVGPDGGEVASSAPSRSDGRVKAPAPDLYLLLWNRRPADGLEVEGDAAVLADWSQRVRVRWS